MFYVSGIVFQCLCNDDLLLCRRSTSNKTCYRQWFDWCIISKMILKSGSNWLFPVIFSVEITLSGSHSGNSFEFSHRLTGFLNYALFCLSFCYFILFTSLVLIRGVTNTRITQLYSGFGPCRFWMLKCWRMPKAHSRKIHSCWYPCLVVIHLESQLRIKRVIDNDLIDV
jgi:hypothetical protein